MTDRTPTPQHRTLCRCGMPIPEEGIGLCRGCAFKEGVDPQTTPACDFCSDFLSVKKKRCRSCTEFRAWADNFPSLPEIFRRWDQAVTR